MQTIVLVTNTASLHVVTDCRCEHLHFYIFAEPIEHVASHKSYSTLDFKTGAGAENSPHGS